MNMNKVRLKHVHPMVMARISAGTKQTLSVIIYSNKTIDEIKECVLEKNGRIKYELPCINAVAAEIPSDSLDHIASHSMIKFIDDDTKVFKTVDIAGTFIGAKEVNDFGYTGKNIGIAIIDTGVAPHNDLVRPLNRIVAFKDFINNKSNPYDDDGHGTHVAGIAAGNGFSLSKYRGIAPEANIIAVKALDESGGGSTSDILAGIQWVIDHKDEYNIKVLNLSLGTPADISYHEDPLAKGAASAVSHGICVVAAAGNSGPNRRTINSPGIHPNVITVGAIDDNRTTSYEDVFVADFSSRGPTPSGKIKPDVLAPGVDIVSLSNSNLSGYISHSGTSMATPFVSGAIALLYDKNREALSPDRVKRIVQTTAIPIRGESRAAQGFGVANIINMLDIKEKNMEYRQKPIPANNSSYRSNLPFPSDDMNLLFLIFLLL